MPGQHSGCFYSHFLCVCSSGPFYMKMVTLCFERAVLSNRRSVPECQGAGRWPGSGSHDAVIRTGAISACWPWRAAGQALCDLPLLPPRRRGLWALSHRHAGRPSGVAPGVEDLGDVTRLARAHLTAVGSHCRSTRQGAGQHLQEKEGLTGSGKILLF